MMHKNLNLKLYQNLDISNVFISWIDFRNCCHIKRLFLAAEVLKNSKTETTISNTLFVLLEGN